MKTSNITMRQKVTKSAINKFIVGSSSSCNAYKKPWVVNMIYGVLNGSEPRKDLYEDFEFTFGSYTEKSACSGRSYFFDYEDRSISDNLGNKIYFLFPLKPTQHDTTGK